jgi:hypothetical protein
MWVETTKASTLTFNLMVGNDFVVPDPSTNAVLTVRNRSGSVLHTETVINPTSSQLVFAIPSATNTLTGSNTNEARLASLSYTSGGFNRLLEMTYKVTQFIPFTVTSQSVRALLGLSYEELEDEEVDIISAYYALVNSNSTTFTTAFTTEGYKGDQANKAVCLQCAIDLALSLPQRIAQKTDEEKASFQRATKFDPYKLVAGLKVQLAETLESLVTEQTIGSATIFVASQPTDPFTGA